MKRKCSYRTFQINHNGEVWCITQDVRRTKNPRTGESYMGKLTERELRHYVKIMNIQLVIRLKHWHSVKSVQLKAV